MEPLTFEDHVVVVTGAGNGIGRAYAHEFARRGAKVVVNDLGGSVSGDGSDRGAADAVVDEITAANGNAIANYDSVVDGERVVAAALSKWGRIDVLINNAGIAYGTPFGEMTSALWRKMLEVHVDGSYACSRAAWPAMVEQGFGRLMFTSSPFGLHAERTFSHYSAAKAALIGLTKALALEGQEHNICANAVAPFSASRMTGKTNDEQQSSAFGPRYLAQLAIWLSHASNSETGSVFEVGGGYIHKVRLELSRGVHLLDAEHTAENIARDAAKLDDFADAHHPGLGEWSTIGKESYGEDWSQKF